MEEILKERLFQEIIMNIKKANELLVKLKVRSDIWQRHQKPDRVVDLAHAMPVERLQQMAKTTQLTMEMLEFEYQMIVSKEEKNGGDK